MKQYLRSLPVREISKDQHPGFVGIYDNMDAWIYDNLTIEGNLDLNDETLEAGAIIIESDLHINGDILNTDINTGTELYVHGNIKAENLVAGGSFITCQSNASIRGMVITIGNDGMLTILGTLKSSYLYSSEHYNDIGHLDSSTRKITPQDIESINPALYSYVAGYL